MTKTTQVENKIQSKSSNVDNETSQEEKTQINKSQLINLSKYSNENNNISKEPNSKGIQNENKFYICQEINKGPWTPYEDNQLKKYVQIYGPKKWNQCAEFIKNRTGKQCREHWINCLNPEVKKGNWSPEEDLLIMILYKKFNGSWRDMIHYFKGRTENSIKNRFFSQLRKIAANNKIKKNKKRSSKINLDNLLIYLEQGIKEAKMLYKTENKLNDKELEDFLIKIEFKKKIEKKRKNKKILEKNKNYSNKNILLGKKREKNSCDKKCKIIQENINNEKNAKKIFTNINEITRTTELAEQNLINDKKEIKENCENHFLEEPKENNQSNESFSEEDDINNFLQMDPNEVLNSSFSLYGSNREDETEEITEKNYECNFINNNTFFKHTNSDIISRLNFNSNDEFFPVWKR